MTDELTTDATPEPREIKAVAIAVSGFDDQTELSRLFAEARRAAVQDYLDAGHSIDETEALIAAQENGHQWAVDQLAEGHAPSDIVDAILGRERTGHN